MATKPFGSNGRVPDTGLRRRTGQAAAGIGGECPGPELPELSNRNPIHAVALHRSGVLIQVPRPERFAIHKLIVADWRQGGPDQLKARKERAQAEFLVAVLSEDRPDDLAESFEDAISRGHRWRDRINASLKRMPETAERLSARI